MITCPNCRHQEMDGELYCSECGARLWDLDANLPPTVTFDTNQLADKVGGSGFLTSLPELQAGQIALNMQGARQPVLLEGKQEYTLGREGADQQAPDVNLAPYGAREKGVSRRHAVLRIDRRQLLLMDLGSSNGTQLNGTPLVAHEPVRLENGDEIRFGKLVARIYFKI